MLGIIIYGRIIVDTGRQGLGVNALVPTLFISSHSTLDLRACLTEKECHCKREHRVAGCEQGQDL